jgi:NAD(P)H-binding
VIELRYKKQRLIIYGATGYTGQLVSEQAKRAGLDFVVAGRDAAKVGALAQKLDVTPRVFSVEDAEGMRSALDGCTAILNCAGPFARTARPVRRTRIPDYPFVNRLPRPAFRSRVSVGAPLSQSKPSVPWHRSRCKSNAVSKIIPTFAGPIQASPHTRPVFGFRHRDERPHLEQETSGMSSSIILAAVWQQNLNSPAERGRL